MMKKAINVHALDTGNDRGNLFSLEREENKNNLKLKNQIIMGDCFELIKKVEKNSIDLIATDPPYLINYEGMSWDNISLNWKFLAREFNRILKPDGNLILFQGWSNVLETRAVLDEMFFLKNWIIYDRIKGRGAKTNFVSTREDILWYVKDEGNYKYNKMSSTILKKTGGTIGNRNGNKYRALSNVWTDISPIVPWSQEKVAHPTQKPVQLLERIVNIFSDEGDIVLDCFAGSGTTAVACKKHKRHFICFEKNSEYVHIAQKRLESCL